jgi:membrane protein implicated in regulation of membrane protease activity
MIPAVPGAALAGWLLLMLSFVVGGCLLLWWGTRAWSARRGRPRPPLRTWQWIAAMALSVLPIFTAVGLAQIAWQDYRQEQFRAGEERLRHITLAQPVAWGDITLPAGSHLQRDLPQGPVEEADGLPDLRGLREVRFPHPVRIGAMWVGAMGVSGQVALELARPHRFAAQDGKPAQECEAGLVALFNARRPPPLDAPFPPLLDGLVMADWVFDTCFDGGTSMSVRYWKGGQLVWADAPDYGRKE